MTGLLYLEGQLDAGRARDVSAHVAACGSCRELLGALEKEAVWLHEALATDEESLPARLVAKPERGSIGWGWVVAFGLGVGGAYTLVDGIHPALAHAGGAGRLHAGKCSYDALLHGRFLERMGYDANPPGIHGSGNFRNGCNLAAPETLAALYDDRVRDGRDRLRPRADAFGRGPRRWSAAIPVTRCPPARK